MRHYQDLKRRKQLLYCFYSFFVNFVNIYFLIIACAFLRTAFIFCPFNRVMLVSCHLGHMIYIATVFCAIYGILWHIWDSTCRTVFNSITRLLVAAMTFVALLHQRASLAGLVVL